MDTIKLIISTIFLFTSCASQEWRHGNYNKDVKVNNKRERQRDKYMERATDFRVGTAKHYINEHKKRDGKINLFYRDGFDFDF